MVKKNQGMPEESELVLCTVTKIYPHCVFVNIDNYLNKQGMIHISEISPGRIRNIHDYVKVGKKVICKVLRTDEQKGHIDLSLRRVSEGQKREKAEELKKELKSEKIVEFVAQQLKMDKDKLYDQLISKTETEYDSLHDFFEEFIIDESIIKKLGLQPKVQDKLAEVIKQRVKPLEVEIEGEIKIKSYGPEGVNVVKKILSEAENVSDSIRIRYKGGGSYSIIINDSNYKDAEKTMEKATGILEKGTDKNSCEYSFERIEKKKKATA